MKMLNSLLLEGVLVRSEQKELFDENIEENFAILSDECSMGVKIEAGSLLEKVKREVNNKKSRNCRIVGKLSGSYKNVVIVADHIEFKPF